jgi:hypothetical protein
LLVLIKLFSVVKICLCKFVSFGGGQRLGQVLFDKFAVETGPSGEESGVDSFDPGRWDGAAGSLMQVLHDVLLAL